MHTDRRLVRLWRPGREEQRGYPLLGRSISFPKRSRTRSLRGRTPPRRSGRRSTSSKAAFRASTESPCPGRGQRRGAAGRRARPRPENVPDRGSSKSASAILKPSEVCSKRRQAGGTLRRVRLGGEEAVTLVLAAGDAAAELVELREAEPFRLEDHHQRGVGDVDTDFDDGRRDEDVEVAVPEGVHRPLPAGAVHPAVDESQAGVRGARPAAGRRTSARRYRHLPGRRCWGPRPAPRPRSWDRQR